MLVDHFAWLHIQILVRGLLLCAQEAENESHQLVEMGQKNSKDTLTVGSCWSWRGFIQIEKFPNDGHGLRPNSSDEGNLPVCKTTNNPFEISEDGEESLDEEKEVDGVDDGFEESLLILHHLSYGELYELLVRAGLFFDNELVVAQFAFTNILLK